VRPRIVNRARRDGVGEYVLGAAKTVTNDMHLAVVDLAA
jgi:hypothetical protein